MNFKHQNVKNNTENPINSNNLEMDSPIIVERKCPTCICLAILGEEKSTITCFFDILGSVMPLR